jgi:hypothetical protein
MSTYAFVFVPPIPSLPNTPQDPIVISGLTASVTSGTSVIFAALNAAYGTGTSTIVTVG